jgi:hypothetical protein
MPRTAKAKVTPKMRKRTRATNVHVHIHPPAQASDEQFEQILENGDASPDGPDSDPDSDPFA